MKINVKTAGIFPMPVLMVATYNADGSVDVMNAAWGTMVEPDIVALNLTASHKTVKNILERKAFTVAFADAAHVAECDYLGIVSGNNFPDKFAKTGLTATKSDKVDAPIINELPVSMECEFIEYQDGAYGLGVIGKIVGTVADEKIVKSGKVDVEKMQAIAFDTYTLGYYKVTERVGEAFREGKKLK